MAKNLVDIMSIVNAAQENLIYGAGVYGRKIYQILTILRLEHKVKSFVVTVSYTHLF